MGAIDHDETRFDDDDYDDPELIRKQVDAEGPDTWDNEDEDEDE